MGVRAQVSQGHSPWRAGAGTPAAPLGAFWFPNGEAAALFDY